MNKPVPKFDIAKFSRAMTAVICRSVTALHCARVETQLGYKSLKFLRRIVVTDRFDDHGRNGNLQNGWSWYAGI
jgi:hypothetical protein